MGQKIKNVIQEEYLEFKPCSRELQHMSLETKMICFTRPRLDMVLPLGKSDPRCFVIICVPIRKLGTLGLRLNCLESYKIGNKTRSPVSNVLTF